MAEGGGRGVNRNVAADTIPSLTNSVFAHPFRRGGGITRLWWTSMTGVRIRIL